jgi:hypothetical protein
MTGESQYELYKKAIARIYRSSDGCVIGSGFLVFGRHVLTCAHVVADALGIDHTTEDCPQGWVELDFPIPATQRRKPKIKAMVVFWQPISPSGQWEYGDDIAVLKLEEKVAKDICPVGLALAGNLMNTFHVLGFPAGYDDGVWTYGEFRGEQGTGWVQIVVTGQSDYFVEGGFSGAPVWDDTLQGVAGIMVAAELSSEGKREAVKAAFMIPARILGESWCDLKSCIVEATQSPGKDLTSSVPIAQPSSNQKVADLLWLLNYRTQERNFRDVIERQSEGAFLVQAEEKIIQHWLVRRLAGCVPDFEKAQRFSIRMRGYSIRQNFEAFWSQFKLESVSHPSRESVIQGVAELCRKKSVIIALYGLSDLDPEKLTQLHDFWQRLVEQVRSIPTTERYFRSRLILLLAEGNSSTIQKRLHPFQFVAPTASAEAEPQSPIALAPLEQILPNDVKTWLGQESVYSSLNRAEEDVQSIVHRDIPNWEPEPSQVLEEICQTLFQISDGIAVIEPYWKLAG